MTRLRALSASWLNMVEISFRAITVNRLRQGAFASVHEVVAVIDQYVADHNMNPGPFIWNKSASCILLTSCCLEATHAPQIRRQAH